MNDTLQRSWRVLKTLVLSTGVVIAGASGAWIAKPTLSETKTGSLSPSQLEPPKAERISRIGADRVKVPEAVADKMGLSTEPVVSSTQPIHLPPFQGSLSLDNNCLQRVHARFPGEIVRMSTVSEPAPRDLRVGDVVMKGQLLALVWSSSFGNMKSDLVGALSKLRSDEQILARLKELSDLGGTPESTLRAAEQTVRDDRLAVERTERTLQSNRVTDEELAKLRAEADQLKDAKGKKSDAADWANVEVRANQSGTILVKNVNVGDIVDTSLDLFQIGDLSHLTIWAHVYEDDLPRLAEVPKPIRWSVAVPSRPGVVLNGTLEQISAVIDPNQHTALVSGRIENPRGELKIGQFVTAQVDLPPPPGELAVPADAVAEDGRDSIVFVQSADDRTVYLKCSLQVVRRTRQTLYVKVGSGMRAGDRVVTAGSLLLREAVDALPVPAN